MQATIRLIDRRHSIVLAVLLGLATLAVYAPVRGFEFVDYDDRFYVAENARVQKGLTGATVAWAATAQVVGHWHPLTLLSHAFDWTLYGSWAGGHHLTNLALHVLNVLLLFALLVRTTASPVRSAVAAALFALHPLRVESVAWVAERKDVLSGTLFFATLHAYVGWVRRPTAARYALACLAFAGALMAKPMVVTLPVVALLLDRWPLARATSLRTRIIEKLPLLGLSAISALLTVFAARSSALADLDYVPVISRVTNAIVSLAWYLAKTVWPSDLAILYLHPAMPGGQAVSWVAHAASIVLLAGVSTWVWRESRRRYLVTGWLWYLVMLLPVLGFAQAGMQARADRYTYLPTIGVYLMIVWRAGDVLAHQALGVAARRAVAATVVVLLLGCAALSRRQLMVWRDSESLYGHALAVDPDNFLVHLNLGTVLVRAGRDDDAIPHFERSLAAYPGFSLAHRALGNALERRGQIDDAVRHYQIAVDLDPRDGATLRLLGDGLLAQGKARAAVEQYRALLALDDDDAHTHNNLGNALLALNDEAGARLAYARAVELNPAMVGARGNLAARLEAAGEWAAAVEQRRVHVRLDPTSAEAQQALASALLHEGDPAEALQALRAARRLDATRADTRRLLAWVLATRSAASTADGVEALRLAEEGVPAGESADPVVLTTLAAAQAAAGRFADALETAKWARVRAVAAGDANLVAAIDDMQERFRRGEPYRDPS